MEVSPLRWDILHTPLQPLNFQQTVYRTRCLVLLEMSKQLNVLSGIETCVDSNRGPFTSRSWFSPTDGIGASSMPSTIPVNEHT